MSQDEEELSTFLKKQILQDLDKRNLNGSYIYLAAWLLIGSGSGFYLANLQLYLLTAAILTLLAVSRISHYFIFQKSLLRSQTLRVIWNYFNILVPALVYSIILSLAFYGPPFEGIFLYILITVFALLSAGTVNFAPDIKLSFCFVFILTFMPFIVAVLFTDDHQLLGLMLALYAFYMLLLAFNLNKEYLLRLRQQYSLGQLNFKDGLTGIGNRRLFDQAKEARWKSCLRSNSPLSLILIDIDYFKRINDQFGHATGDQVIQRVAQIIQSICKRETDVVSRIGGEEYAILFDGGEQQYHYSLTERIRATIEAEEFESDNAIARVTASIGVAFTIPTKDKSAAEFFKVADKNLYAAKENGRNQVVIKDY